MIKDTIVFVSFLLLFLGSGSSLAGDKVVPCPQQFSSRAWVRFMEHYGSDVEPVIQRKQNMNFLEEFRTGRQSGVFAVSNRVLGRLNVRHKGFSSAIRNYIQSAMIEAYLFPADGNADELDDYHRSVDLLERVSMYRDYRDMAIAGGADAIPTLQTILERVLDGMRLDLSLIEEVPELVEGAGIGADPSGWFGVGFGDDYYQAFLASKMAKPGEVASFDQIQDEIVAKLQKAERLFAEIAQALPAAMLHSDGGLNVDAINVIRKLAEPQTLRQALIDKFGVTMTLTQVKKLKQYMDLSYAALAPPLLKLPEAQLQLMSGDGSYLVTIDFKDVGAENIRQILIAASRIGQGLRACMERALEGWDIVTEWLRNRQFELRKILQSVDPGILLSVSGDDGVIVLKERDDSLIEKIVLALAGSEYPDMVRLAGVDRSGFSSEDQLQVAAESGEAFEKEIRSRYCKSSTRAFCASLSIFVMVDATQDGGPARFQAIMSSRHATSADQAEIEKLANLLGGAVRFVHEN